ncbi:MAG: hypothetical protein ACRDJH_05380 [Thermomicrobiales bacterium]
MEDARRWTQAPVFDGGAGVGNATGSPPGAEQQRVISGIADRFFSGLRRLALGERNHYRAAEGATDAELARLARTGAWFGIEDARWQHMRSLPSGGRHV